MKGYRNLIIVALTVACLLPGMVRAAPVHVPEAAAGPVLTITSATANVRAGPGTTYPVIGSARKGQQLPITGRVAGNAWWQVDFKGKPAWIAASVASVSQDAGNAPVVTQIPPPPAKGKGAAVAESPGAGRIAFAIGRGAESDIALLDVASGAKPIVTGNGRQPDIRHDGWIVFNGQGGGKDSLFSVKPDGSFLTQVSRFAEDSYPQWAPNNMPLIYHSNAGFPEARIYYQADTDGPTDVTNMGVAHEMGKKGSTVPVVGQFPTWVAPGRIAYNGCDAWVGGSRCGMWSIDTGKFTEFRPLQLTDHTSDRPTDAFGSTLLFSRSNGGNWDIYAINATPPARRIDPKAVPVQLTGDPAQDVGATFSPDGKRIAFISNRGGAWGIWVMNADGGNPRLLAPVPEGFGPQWEEERLSWGR
jgi:hypothetical protein